MKLRSALTYGFGRRPDRATQPWTLNKQNGEWEGNPSGSIQVGRYMVALRKRKVWQYHDPIPIRCSLKSSMQLVIVMR